MKNPNRRQTNERGSRYVADRLCLVGGDDLAHQEGEVMSKTTLADLRVPLFGRMGPVRTEALVDASRSATAQDLIEAVESIGGEVVEVTEGELLFDNPVLVVANEPGRYLVLRIEEDE